MCFKPQSPIGFCHRVSGLGFEVWVMRPGFCGLTHDVAEFFSYINPSLLWQKKSECFVQSCHWCQCDQVSVNSTGISASEKAYTQ